MAELGGMMFVFAAPCFRGAPDRFAASMNNMSPVHDHG